MKLSVIIFLGVAFFVLVCVIAIEVGQMVDLNRIQQTEIDFLKAENIKDRDLLEKKLYLTRDSLTVAFETIRQATKEREIAHERTQQTIRNLQKIIFITHTDSSRNAELTKLYPTFKTN